MPKVPAKAAALCPTKEVSVMAWIEDPANGVLLVRQSAKYFWSARKGPITKPSKIRTSTHQLPTAGPQERALISEGQLNKSQNQLDVRAAMLPGPLLKLIQANPWQR